MSSEQLRPSAEQTSSHDQPLSGRQLPPYILSFPPVGAHRLEVPVLARVPLGACRLEAPILAWDLTREPEEKSRAAQRWRIGPSQGPDMTWSAISSISPIVGHRHKLL